jgi:hypothetical protein
VQAEQIKEESGVKRKAEEDEVSAKRVKVEPDSEGELGRLVSQNGVGEDGRGDEEVEVSKAVQELEVSGGERKTNQQAQNVQTSEDEEEPELDVELDPGPEADD